MPLVIIVAMCWRLKILKMGGGSKRSERKHE
jgi:hypothetical protein